MPRAAVSCQKMAEMEVPTFCSSVLPNRNHPLATIIGDNIFSHLVISVDYNFSDNSSGSGSIFSHCYGDSNIRMRPEVVLVIYIARQSALVVKISVL